MTFPSFEAAKAGYTNMLRTMVVRPEKRTRLEVAARTILRGKSRYLAVERTTGVPWFMIGILHYRESDCSFTTHLHNGDPLSGRTYHKPPGRPPHGNPPFKWEDSAQDALSYEGFASIHDWSLERIGYSCEKYNGEGYMIHNVNDPYVWSGSNHYGDSPNIGKYTADGQWAGSVIDQQLGCLPVLAVMREIDSSINLWLKSKGTEAPPVVIEPPKPPVEAPAKYVAGIGIAAALAALAKWWGAHPGVTVAIFVGAIALFAFIMSRQK